MPISFCTGWIDRREKAVGSSSGGFNNRCRLQGHQRSRGSDSHRTPGSWLVGGDRLSEVLGRKVDLLTESAISPYLKDRILNELMVIYGTR